MNKKTALITGASSGIGRLTAIEMKKKDFASRRQFFRQVFV